MSGANNRVLDGTSRFLERQMGAWLFTLSFPAYCSLIRLLLSRCGYSTVRALDPGSSPSVSGRRYSGQGGLDLLAFAHTDMATFLSAVGVKTGRIPLGRRFVDELRGAMSRVKAEQGLLFTTATISAKTWEVAGASGLSPVHLVDGQRLARMLIERRIGVRPIDDEWEFDARFFETLEERAQRYLKPGRRRRR